MLCVVSGVEISGERRQRGARYFSEVTIPGAKNREVVGAFARALSARR